MAGITSVSMEGLQSALNGLNIGETISINLIVVILTLLIGTAITRDLHKISILQLPIALALGASGVRVGGLAIAIYAVIYVVQTFNITNIGQMFTATADRAAEAYTSGALLTEGAYNKRALATEQTKLQRENLLYRETQPERQEKDTAIASYGVLKDQITRESDMKRAVNQTEFEEDKARKTWELRRAAALRKDEEGLTLGEERKRKGVFQRQSELELWRAQLGDDVVKMHQQAPSQRDAAFAQEQRIQQATQAFQRGQTLTPDAAFALPRGKGLKASKEEKITHKLMKQRQDSRYTTQRELDSRKPKWTLAGAKQQWPQLAALLRTPNTQEGYSFTGRGKVAPEYTQKGFAAQHPREAKRLAPLLRTPDFAVPKERYREGKPYRYYQGKVKRPYDHRKKKWRKS